MPDVIGTAKAIEMESSSASSPDPAQLDAIALLETDHAEVAGLFAKFEDSQDPKEQLELAAQICIAVQVHAQLEEEIFYPAAEEILGEDDQHLLAEAEVEHDTVKGLISAIEESVEDPLFEAKVKVLGEYVQHHVEEEENELFPKLLQAEMEVVGLGLELASRKEELMLQAKSLLATERKTEPENAGRDDNEWARDGGH